MFKLLGKFFFALLTFYPAFMLFDSGRIYFVKKNSLPAAISLLISMLGTLILLSGVPLFIIRDIITNWHLRLQLKSIFAAIPFSDFLLDNHVCLSQ